MGKLKFEVILEGADDLLQPLVDPMRSLEQFSELSLQVFCDLIGNSLLNIYISLDSAALTTGNFGAVVRPGRRLELVTAAFTALQMCFHQYCSVKRPV